MKYENIVLQAYWFEEGEFWNICAEGYKSRDNEDPTTIEVDPHCLDKSHSEDDVKDELNAIALGFLLPYDNMTNHVLILLNGNEVQTMTQEVETKAS